MQPFGANDEPVGRRADEVKRIASDERQHLALAGVQHRNVVRAHHARRYHAITILAVERSDRDDVVGVNILQRPKKRIAVTGKGTVARLSRQRGAGNMAHRAPKNPCVVPFDQYNGEAETRDFKAANQTTGLNRRQMASRVADLEQAPQIDALPVLEDGRIDENEATIPQEHGTAGKEQTLGPPQDRVHPFSVGSDFHSDSPNLAVFRIPHRVADLLYDVA